MDLVTKKELELRLKDRDKNYYIPKNSICQRICNLLKSNTPDDTWIFKIKYDTWNNNKLQYRKRKHRTFNGTKYY